MKGDKYDEMGEWVDSIQGKVPDAVHDLIVAAYDGLGYQFDYMGSRKERDSATAEMMKVFERALLEVLS